MQGIKSQSINNNETFNLALGIEALKTKTKSDKLSSFLYTITKSYELIFQDTYLPCKSSYSSYVA